MNFSLSYNTTGNDSDLFAALFGFLAAMWLFCLVLVIVAIIAQWKIFQKAGREGWKAIIPFYNMYVLTEIAGLNGWYFLLCLIPGVGSVIWLIWVAIKLAPAFGKDTGFSIGLILLPVIFYMILGFGSAEYKLGKPASATASASNSGASHTAAPKKDEDPWVAGENKK